MFSKGFGVMSSVYASPRVVVLQHRRMPRERELALESFGGVAPKDRPDLIPYAGAECRSGWCIFETACSVLTTTGGGHAYELGVGKVKSVDRAPSMSWCRCRIATECRRAAL
eukprot:7003100-Prymnesium_polylepis.1